MEEYINQAYLREALLKGGLSISYYEMPPFPESVLNQESLPFFLNF